MNKKKAFALLKKSCTKLVYRDGDTYWVSNSHFVFKTKDEKLLMSLGLIDFNGDPEENSGVVEHAVANAVKKAVLRYTRILVDESVERTAALLKNENLCVAVDADYLEPFKGCDEITSSGLYYSPIYFWSDGALEGLILPLRQVGVLQEVMEKLAAVL